MGLAPYGRPRYMKEFRDMILTEEGGRFRLNLDYFRHHAEGVDMTWDNGSPVIGRIFSDQFEQTFGAARRPGAQLAEREQDIASSLQRRLEEVSFHVLRHCTSNRTQRLGLSGGVPTTRNEWQDMLNTPFAVFVQPAAGDSGTAWESVMRSTTACEPKARIRTRGRLHWTEFTNAEIKS